MRTFIGIDNGLSGAIAIIDEAVTVHKVPVIRSSKGKVTFDEPAMAGFFLPLLCSDIFCAIERVQAMPKQGLTSAINFGLGHGIWRGLVAEYARRTYNGKESNG